MPSSWDRFNEIIQGHLNREGGLNTDPRDPGGITKYGISHNNNPGVDIRNLTPEMAKKIYYTNYYLHTGLDKVADPKVREFLFDIAGGPEGPADVQKVLKLAGGVRASLQDMAEARLQNLRTKGNWNVYAKPWTNRVKGLVRSLSGKDYVANNNDTQPEQPNWIQQASTAAGSFLNNLFHSKSTPPGPQTDYSAQASEAAHNFLNGATDYVAKAGDAAHNFLNRIGKGANDVATGLSGGEASAEVIPPNTLPLSARKPIVGGIQSQSTPQQDEYQLPEFKQPTLTPYQALSITPGASGTIPLPAGSPSIIPDTSGTIPNPGITSNGPMAIKFKEAAQVGPELVKTLPTTPTPLLTPDKVSATAPPKLDTIEGPGTPPTNFWGDFHNRFWNAIKAHSDDKLARQSGNGVGATLGELTGDLPAMGVAAALAAPSGGLTIPVTGAALAATAEAQRQRLAGENNKDFINPKVAGAGTIGAVTSLIPGINKLGPIANRLLTGLLHGGVQAGGDVVQQGVEQGSITPKIDLSRTATAGAMGAAGGLIMKPHANLKVEVGNGERPIGLNGITASNTQPELKPATVAPGKSTVTLESTNPMKQQQVHFGNALQSAYQGAIEKARVLSGEVDPLQAQVTLGHEINKAETTIAKLEGQVAQLEPGNNLKRAQAILTEQRSRLELLRNAHKDLLDTSQLLALHNQDLHANNEKVVASDRVVRFANKEAKAPAEIPAIPQRVASPKPLPMDSIPGYNKMRPEAVVPEVHPISPESNLNVARPLSPDELKARAEKASPEATVQEPRTSTREELEKLHPTLSEDAITELDNHVNSQEAQATERLGIMEAALTDKQQETIKQFEDEFINTGKLNQIRRIIKNIPEAVCKTLGLH